AFDVRVDEMEQPVRVSEAGCPDAARVGIAEHVELAWAGERAREKSPVNQIARVMNLHAGKPLESGRGDIIILPHAHNGRVGIEAGQDGIVNFAVLSCHGWEDGKFRHETEVLTSLCGERNSEGAGSFKSRVFSFTR